MGNNLQCICRETVNTNLTLYFLFLDTSPLTGIPTTGHGKEVMYNACKTFFKKDALRGW